MSKEASVITGIIGAMEEEVNSLMSAMTEKTTTCISDMIFCKGLLDGKPVVVVKSGVGKVNAGVCAQLLITDFGADRIINTGVAGSLDNSIDIGDIVVSTDAVLHDYDISPIGFPPGMLFMTDFIGFPADEKMRALAVRSVKAVAPEIKVFEGRVCSGDQFISSHEQKEKIISVFGGLCCDMEGAAIAQICHQNKVPYVIVRAISDKADGSVEMAFETFMEQAAARCARVVRHMAATT